MRDITFIFALMSFYLFYFNGLSFLCCSETGYGLIAYAAIKENKIFEENYAFNH